MIKNHIAYNNFSDWQFQLKKAEGSYIWDSQGKKLLDFTSGWNVTNLGWNHPEVNEAVIKQAKKNVYAPMWSADPIQEQYAAALTKALPKSLNTVCRATGGTEANEEALKIARAVTGRKKIIGFRDSYHGQSFASVALGTRPEWALDIAPLVPEFIQMIYPTTYHSGKSEMETLADFAENLVKLLRKKDIAAVFTEPGIITGWGTTDVAPHGYLKLLRQLTKQYGTLLIVDEVGSGFSRCGKLFGIEFEQVTPDIITFAKGISNGAAPIGACIANSDMLDPVIPKTKLVSTFGWTPLACAAGLATLKVHQRDKLWQTAQTNGAWMLEALKQELTDHPAIGSIHGLGMEIGVTFVTDKKSKKPDTKLVTKIIPAAYKRGLHIVDGGDGNIQLMPPLTTTRKDLTQGLDIFVDTVKKAAR